MTQNPKNNRLTNEKSGLPRLLIPFSYGLAGSNNQDPLSLFLKGEKMKSLLKSIIFLIVILFLTVPGYAAQSGWSNFKTITYTGTGANQQITGLGFKPDFVWIKSRSAAHEHMLYDSVRGAGLALRSNRTSTEWSVPTSLLSFDEDGFTLGAFDETNRAGSSFVAWCWKAGNTSGANNTDGSITSTVNAGNLMSVVSFRGSGATATIGHGLPTTPKLIILKNRSASVNWAIYSSGLGATQALKLNTTDAAVTADWWNTAPTDSVFSIGSSLSEVGNDFIAYCFAEIPGVSSIGSYTGNGSTTGPVIDCGFKPDWIMMKRADSTSSWVVMDTKQGIYDNGVAENYLLASSSNASASYDYLSLTDTGFQITQSETTFNSSGANVIYMAFAEREAPEITLTTDKTTVDYSQSESATLTWDVSYADSVTIEPGIGTVELSGNTPVSPVAGTTYTLTATVGEFTLTEQIQINVANGFDQDGVFSINGKIGVGVVNPTNALEVNGTIKAREVMVTSQGWADYVFDTDYDLKSLTDVDAYIRDFNHLPGLPSADDLASEGIPVSLMFELQMKKIEELTLYVIELSKKNEDLETRIRELE